jgi:hypothetical protein
MQCRTNLVFAILLAESWPVKQNDRVGSHSNEPIQFLVTTTSLVQNQQQQHIQEFGNRRPSFSRRTSLSMSRADGGKLIHCNREQPAKAALSIRCKFDADSNEIDESELQDEKHDLHKCETDDGIIIVVNPEE